MRKRSGAIHSQSEEQFILLAEKAYGKTGIFYDDKHYHKIGKSFRKKQTPNNPQPSNSEKPENPFKDFDFNEKIEEQQDLRKLEKEMQAHGISCMSIVVLCSKNQLVFHELQPSLSEQKSDRGFDLLIRKKSSTSDKQYVFKYWIINQSLCENILCEVYLQQAIKIYGVGIEKSKEELGRVLKKYEIEEVEMGGIRTVFEKFEFSKIQNL